MTHLTPVLEGTTILVIFCVLFVQPNRTLLRQILIDIGFTAIVLPVVSVDALISRVSLITKWTPHGFVIEHKKVHVFIQLFQ